ncbi:hypothetical protein HNV12_04400 [Methanococcoides sp. SA1]|nr:hypothetical protein [Methanococcoides sp. SA1]
MVTTITEVLNIWNDIGVFSYVIPFLLIFAVVFAILKKTKILSSGTDENNGILAIISVALGLLSLQFDFVSEFFAVIFPRFGIGLSLFLVLIIFIGFFAPDRVADKGLKGSWIGFIIGIGTVIWALSEWDQWNNVGGFGGWFGENIWALLILGGIIAVIVVVAKGKDTE